jgi:hypothetical protein
MGCAERKSAVDKIGEVFEAPFDRESSESSAVRGARS